jgi:hypothetical protein
MEARFSSSSNANLGLDLSEIADKPHGILRIRGGGSAGETVAGDMTESRGRAWSF